MAGHDVGPSTEAPAPELIESGFALEIADAPLLHDGLNLADLAHLLVLAECGVVPPGPAARVVGAILDVVPSVSAGGIPNHAPPRGAITPREGSFLERAGAAARWHRPEPPR